MLVGRNVAPAGAPVIENVRSSSSASLTQTVRTSSAPTTATESPTKAIIGGALSAVALRMKLISPVRMLPGTPLPSSVAVTVIR